MPEISVIVPVYNTEKYLSACLDSVLGQTFQDIEVICINDGSPDHAAEILSGYSQKDERIIVVNQSNQGLSAARNAGLDRVTGRFICFVDSDDMLPPYALETLYQIAKSSKADIVASRSFGTTNQHEIKYTLHENTVFNDFVHDKRIFSSVTNKLYKADLFQTQRFLKGMLFEDWPIITILFGQVRTYATTNIPCYIYREENVSITRSAFSEKKCLSYIQGIRIVYRTFQNSDKLELARKRMAVALKMLINKVYHTHDKQLRDVLLKEVQTLFEEEILLPKVLPLKTRWRLWMLKHC